MYIYIYIYVVEGEGDRIARMYDTKTIKGALLPGTRQTKHVVYLVLLR